MFKPELFARRVREARIERQLTQIQLAKRANLSLKAVSDVELMLRHATNPTVHTICVLAKALGVSEAWLCGWN